MAITVDVVVKQSPLVRREAEMLIEYALGIGRADLLAHPERLLDDIQFRRIQRLIARRAAGEPMAYILGKREFYGLDFKVSPDVLIPRPETELLVEQALARLASMPPLPAPRLLDLGTGSGAIAISIARHFNGAEISATDLSINALAVARHNADALGVTLRLINSDWFEGLGDERFDLIVSNPPYIAAGDPHLEMGDLRFEPVTALTDGAPGEQGLACIRRIIADAPNHLRAGGTLLLEHGYDQSAACAELLAASGFNSLCSFADLAGISRVAAGCWAGGPEIA